MSPLRRPPHVLVAGGGIGALEAVLALRELAGDRLTVTLLAPGRHFTYSPLAVGEPFGRTRALRYPLAAIAETLGVALLRDAIDRVDPHARRVTTQEGTEIGYDALVLALGAQPVQAVPGAVSFRGPRDSARVAAALAGAGDPGRPRRVAFVVPPVATWTLPLYELALMAATHARAAGEAGAELTVVTPEAEPLGVFGTATADAVRRVLADRGIALRTGASATAVAEGRLWLTPGGSLPVDAAIALPRLTGPAIAGLPADADGFVGVDAFGRVDDLADVYAVGDMTRRPLKQGGLTAQQADAAAAAIAEWAGAPIEARPVPEVLRALLLTGDGALWLRRGEPPAPAQDGPLWWPPHKVAARRLAPFLATHERLADAPAVPRRDGAHRYARLP